MATHSTRFTRRIHESVRAYILQQKNNTFNYRQVSAALGYKQPQQQRVVSQFLFDLALEGELIEVSPGKYKAPQRTIVVTGTFVRRSNGKNAIITDDDNEQIFVAERNSKHALNGDRVRASIAAHVRGREPEAEVIDIIERADQQFIGLLRVTRQGAYLTPDSKTLSTEIFIPRTKVRGGRSGDKAVVNITAWPEDAAMPIGEVIDVLGRAGENNTEIHAILAEYGLPYRYPAAVDAAANRIEPGITPDEVATRLDLRGIPTFTIDPRDAKDFDDALSLRRLPNGNFEVGVHIADVTHYVTPDSIIDREGRNRATSVYLVDRVVPMLPEHLSNGVCSLRPDEDKLTFSCIFEITPQAKVLKHRICRTVTRSLRRFTYEEAQEVIETGHGDFADEILALDSLAKILRAKRYENGSVDFERPEVRFDIDDKGRPVDVYFKVAKDANKLIEEFMLLANKTVAEYIGKPDDNHKAKTFVYRIHDQPDPGKLADLARIARTFGYKLRTTGSPRDINRSINRMLQQVKGRPEENFLSTLAIRSMAKAVYSTQNVGHYGLGFDYYTHFTSPIRRYPDMMVHRLLARYLAGGRSAVREKVEDLCKHSSDREQLAANAERSSIKYKQVEYLAARLGEVFTGIISGVTEWGLYVELDDNMCEGLVPMRDLADDYYDFDQQNYCLVGRRRNNRYRLGDRVTVQVARADIEKRMIDFVLVDDRGPLSLHEIKSKNAHSAPAISPERFGKHRRRRK